MYSDIDRALQRLAEDRVPFQLAAVDGAVLRQVADHSFSRRPEFGRLSVVAVGVALLAGVAAGMLPEDRADVQRPLSPLVGGTEFAPSTLLT